MTEARPTRRAAIGSALAAMACLGRPVQAATDVPEAATLLVPGPEGGLSAAFAARGAAAIALRARWCIASEPANSRANSCWMETAGAWAMMLFTLARASRVSRAGGTTAARRY